MVSMESGPDLDGATADVRHDVVLADGEVIEVLGANAYVREGPLTTFTEAFACSRFWASP
jgi:hypothetical protein